MERGQAPLDFLAQLRLCGQEWVRDGLSGGSRSHGPILLEPLTDLPQPVLRGDDVREEHPVGAGRTSSNDGGCVARSLVAPSQGPNCQERNSPRGQSGAAVRTVRTKVESQGSARFPT